MCGEEVQGPNQLGPALMRLRDDENGFVRRGAGAASVLASESDEVRAPPHTVSGVRRGGTAEVGVRQVGESSR